MPVTDDRPTTPAPAESGPIRLPVHENGDYIIDADGFRVAHATKNMGAWKGSIAQIVTALNATASHDKLVETLKDCVLCIEAARQAIREVGGNRTYGPIDECLATARAVLATEKEVG